MASVKPFEIWENKAAGVRFCFSYISDEVVAGALMVKANFELSQYVYRDCSQSLTQLAGQCSITTLANNGEIISTYELGPDNWLEIATDTPCIITNIGEEESVTLFVLKGNPRSVVESIRSSYVPIDRTHAQEA